MQGGYNIRMQGRDEEVLEEVKHPAHDYFSQTVEAIYNETFINEGVALKKLVCCAKENQVRYTHWNIYITGEIYIQLCPSISTTVLCSLYAQPFIDTSIYSTVTLTF